MPLVFNVRWASKGEGHFSIAPSPLSYVPSTGTEFSDKMSFFQRIINVIVFGLMEYQSRQFMLPIYTGLVEKYLGPDVS